MKRKLLTMLLALAMVFAYSLPVFNTDTVANAATSKTQAEAITWAQSKVGTSIDTDGYPVGQPYQCVDLIRSYYTYLGVSPVSGHGKDYATNALPSGWSRVQGGAPQKGDILVYGPSASNEYGHVAIYEGDYATYHQNVNGPYVERITNIKYNGFTNPYWGYIRPDWTQAKPPFGAFDSASGGEKSVTIRGWAIDSDVLTTPLEIHVYIGGPSGTGEGHTGIIANKSRTDVGSAYPGTGNNHGFEATVSTNKYGTQEVYVYAINQGSGSNTLLGHKTVTITKDKPVISDVKVIGNGLDGYLVKCQVKTPNGLDRVQFPTWTTKNGQDDLPSGWETNAKFSGTITKNPYNSSQYDVEFTVKASDHNNESGQYATHIYAYDSIGQHTTIQVPSSDTIVSADNIDREKPVISNVKIVTCTADLVEIQADVSDNTAIDKERYGRRLYYIVGNKRVSGFPADTFTWLSDSKISYSIRGQSVTEKQEIELYLYDKSENQATVTIPIKRTATHYVNVNVGETFSAKEFTGERIEQGGNGLSTWSDYSYYGDVLNNNGDDTFTALKAGKSTLFFVSAKYGTMIGCEVTVTDPSSGSSGTPGAPSGSSSGGSSAALLPAGSQIPVGGCVYQVLAPESRTVAFTKAGNAKSVKVPDTVVISGQTYRVTQVNAKAFTAKKIRTITIGANVSRIAPNAFKSSKATKMIVKTKLLKKSTVRKSLKGSKIKSIKVKVGSKKVNKKFVKKYKKIFKKSNSGKKVSVK